MLGPSPTAAGAAHGAGAGPCPPPVLKGVQRVQSTALTEDRCCKCGWQTALQSVKPPAPGR